MEVQRINPESLPTPLAAYCQVARKGSIVTTAGHIAFDGDGKLVGEGDIRAQTRQTLENIRVSLEAAGASIRDVLQTTVYLSDFDNYKGMNEVFTEYFADNPPARATVRADLVFPTLLVEIQALAVIDGA